MARLETHRVWFVDDEPDERFLMEHALRDINAPVQFRFFENAHSVQQALELAEDGQPPHLIVSDLKMPIMDGIQLATWLRGSRWSFIPFLILSNSGLDRDIALAGQVGVNGYHIKAPNPAQMKTQLSAILEYWLNVVRLPVLDARIGRIGRG